MSNSVRPYRRQPTRLPRPWDSPGKNSRVVAISSSNAWKWKVKVKSLSHVRLLATPWTSAHQAPPSMGLSRQEYWNGVPLPSPGGINNGPQRRQPPIPDLWINPITHAGVIKGSEDVIKIYGLWNREIILDSLSRLNLYTRSFFLFIF